MADELLVVFSIDGDFLMTNFGAKTFTVLTADRNNHL